jgi:hypothetical protein
VNTVGKVVCVVAVLALAGGAGKRVNDPNQVYGPKELGDDVGKGLDRAGGAVGDAAGSAVGGSDLAKGAAIGAGAYGAAKAGKAWRNRSKDDPAHVDVPPVQPTLPTIVPVPGVAQ